MAELTYDSWSGEFGVESRTNWGAWLGYLGVPEANWEAAEKAPDFHMYSFTENGFIMDHKIPAQKVHLHFYAPLDGEWTKCPYPQPTATLWKEEDHKTGTGKPGQWRNTWLQKPCRFQTEIINFAGKGNTVRMTREVLDGGAAIQFDVAVLEPNTDAVVAGPFSTRFKRISNEQPSQSLAEGSIGSFPSPADRYGSAGTGVHVALRLNRVIGALLALGGTIGFAKAGSVPSLIGGVGSGAALIKSGSMADQRSAFLLGSIVSALLTAGMVPRAIKTKKMMPAGMVALLGLIALLTNARQLKSLS